ncbi:E3 ubiquitin-protein ligase RHA2B-like [Malania oleifera]|uniref:E3 ubiquitin-protein ligase RHA2B-like n=1 Tax=Malania oleifera TaxID=397392 RepID=UPI0025ADD003|nr:E3 ubiquitin-protein ligase RHA2B-like [Malania oleifera]
MAALSQFISHLYTMAVIFFTLLLIEVVILVRAVTGAVYSSDDGPITTTRYLELLEEKIPTIRYRSGLRPEPAECTVCLSSVEEGEEIRKLQCKHTFHKVCLDRWLQQDYATCPLCRRTVLPEEIVTKYWRPQNQVDYWGSDEELVFLLSAVQGNSLHSSFL